MFGVFGGIEQSETSSYAYLLWIGVVLFMCFRINHFAPNNTVTAVTD